GHRQAVGNRRRNMPHALDARNAVFDDLGDLRFKLGGSGAELSDRDRDHRNIGRGQAGHCELGKAGPPEREQDDREDHRWKGVADRPCRDIESHQRTCRSSSSASTVLTWSPSCSELPASATTVSPTSSPSRISMSLSETRPTRTLRVSTVFPLTT